MPSCILKILDSPLSLDDAYGAVARPECGGVAIFLGTVRSPNAGKTVRKIHYTAHREMAEAELARIAEEAAAGEEIGGIYVAHRLGELAPGEISVVVAVSAPHRAPAFAVCRAVIEALKKRAPIWKQEFGEEGQRWVQNT